MPRVGHRPPEEKLTPVDFLQKQEQQEADVNSRLSREDDDALRDDIGSAASRAPATAARPGDLSILRRSTAPGSPTPTAVRRSRKSSPFASPGRRSKSAIANKARRGSRSTDKADYRRQSRPRT